MRVLSGIGNVLLTIVKWILKVILFALKAVLEVAKIFLLLLNLVFRIFMASTTSGRKLGSVDGIADYIAGMMFLESDPIFNISYVGTYSKNGTTYYEFRCYR